MPDYTRARTDLGFMRRRVRPGAPGTPTATAAAVSSPAVSPSYSGLSLAPTPPTPAAGLSLAPTTAPTPAPVVAASRLAPIPTVDGKVVLTEANPVVRLNRRSSAIGSLRITGVSGAAWETADKQTGLLGRLPEPPEFGNRPLVQRLDGDVIVGLRHIHQLRRLVLLGTDMTVTTLAGHTVTAHDIADLYISVIDGVIELRREPASGNVSEVYSIGAPA